MLQCIKIVSEYGQELKYATHYLFYVSLKHGDMNRLNFSASVSGRFRRFYAQKSQQDVQK